jgi:hypothetical protein
VGFEPTRRRNTAYAISNPKCYVLARPTPSENSACSSRKCSSATGHFSYCIHLHPIPVAVRLQYARLTLTCPAKVGTQPSPPSLSIGTASKAREWRPAISERLQERVTARATPALPKKTTIFRAVAQKWFRHRRMTIPNKPNNKGRSPDHWIHHPEGLAYSRKLRLPSFGVEVTRSAPSTSIHPPGPPDLYGAVWASAEKKDCGCQ